MKVKHVFRQTSAIVAAIVMATALAAQNRPAKERSAKKEHKDKLHDKAKKAGGAVVLRYRPNQGKIFSSLSDLSAHSDVVIVGRVLGHRPALTPSGNLITNNFLVKVLEVRKGDLAGTRSITVSSPGGAYKFPDGTRAAVVPTGYKELEDGVIYALFLKARGNGANYRLISESQGAFALKQSGVEPADLDLKSPTMKHRGSTPVQFLRELHKAVPVKRRFTPAS
ncbi:MAG TPA: hypothetical protein VIT19_05935 [Pyrinomonadaceae bacterium]